MEEILSEIKGEAWVNALLYGQMLLLRRGIDRCELWRYMGGIVAEARRRYAERFVDWLGPSQVERAQRALADEIADCVLEAD